MFVTGKVHVAVGFVDLSLLLWMDLIPKNSSLFQFVGFELSAINVAKTLAIKAMLDLKDDGNLVDSILQVWYSSCWNQNTLRHFRAGLEGVEGASNESVLSLLN